VSVGKSELSSRFLYFLSINAQLTLHHKWSYPTGSIVAGASIQNPSGGSTVISSSSNNTGSTIMDDMTDEERFNCVISRHCQTMSERQAVLQQLASEKSELTKYAQEMLAERRL
jgi:hypothetical protein